MRQIQVAAKGPDSAFHLFAPRSEGAFYFRGTNSEFGKFIVLGSEPTVTVWASCTYIDKFRTTGSPVNAEFETLQKDIAAKKEASAALVAKAKACPDQPCAQAVFGEQLQLDEEKKAALAELKKKKSPLAPFLALNTFLNADASTKTKYADEKAYFAAEFFQTADLKNSNLDGVAELFYAFKNYAIGLNALGFDETSMEEQLERQLSQLKKGSKSYKMALGGAVTGLAATSKMPLTEKMLNRYGDEFNARNSPEVGRIRYTLNRNRTSMLGVEAPNFTQTTPDGKPVSLHEYKGKVTLVDFWASWCGPCRKENPFVVQAFEKYKPKGFDILGVSLDSDGARWKQAIEADKLTGWKHISDLKGWQNEAAKLYQISSIPQNLLLDRDGKIMARNLRGAQLEQKLMEIFGE